MPRALIGKTATSRYLPLAALPVLLGLVATADAADDLPCSEDATCYRSDQNGNRVEDGDYLAQCTGRFPDFMVPVANIPGDYLGPYFKLAQDFPAESATATDLPWADIDFKAGTEGANAYLYALRDYSYEGMIDVDFQPARNEVRRWYHVPLMNFRNGREMVHGLTKERPLGPGELGLVNKVDNYAVGFYNEIGARAIGAVFAETNKPDIAASQFPAGSMVFKILFTTAQPDDFEDPDNYLLKDAPEWRVAVGGGELTSVRLLQMDVAVRDDRVEETGWVFGTFAFDKDAKDPDQWNRMRPVGLAWGDDPGYTPADQQAGKPLTQGIVSDEIPAYAKGHLGWAGRVNGPVDNPRSSCMSCHGTAQYPIVADLLPSKSCATDEQKLQWFRNHDGQTPFGGIHPETCEPFDPEQPLASLDFSLQVQVALQNLLDYPRVNTCTPPETGSVILSVDRGNLPEFPEIQR
jgi:hypothetical protein